MDKTLFSLEGKKALITGSYQGLGLVLAQGLAAHGAHVILNGRNETAVQNMTEKFNQEGLSASYASFDVTDPSAVNAAIQELEETAGPIDILVNNAGIQRRHPIEEFPIDEWDDVIKVNLSAAFYVSKAVIPGMVRNGQGKIINIGSVQSKLGRATISAYAASKGGIEMLTKNLCAELAQKNIQINGIAPGYFATEMTEALVNDEEFSAWLCGRTPAGRWGDPKELVGAAVFLASDASTFVNGQMIYVDGGMTAVV